MASIDVDIVSKIIEGALENDFSKVKAYTEVAIRDLEKNNETDAVNLLRSKIFGTYKYFLKVIGSKSNTSMTLTDAINRCHDVVSDQSSCAEYKEEHRKLAKWLEQLKILIEVTDSALQKEKTGRDIILNYCKNIQACDIDTLQEAQDIVFELLNNDIENEHCASAFGLEDYVGLCHEKFDIVFTDEERIDRCKRCWKRALALEI